MQKNEQSNTVYKLDSEDYENIYLRIKSRLWKAVFGIFGGVSLIALLTFYSVVDRHAEQQVQKIVEKKEFQQILASTSLARIAELEQRLAYAEELIKVATQQALQLPELPISIDGHSLTLMDKSGEAIQIEFGVAGLGEKKFSRKFHSVPVVAITPLSIEGISPVSTSAISITNGGFHIPIQSEAIKFQYIAIGIGTSVSPAQDK